jgi:hypothetical protein
MKKGQNKTTEFYRKAFLVTMLVMLGIFPLILQAQEPMDTMSGAMEKITREENI